MLFILIANDPELTNDRDDFDGFNIYFPIKKYPQQERAYQRQPTIFQNHKRPQGTKKVTLKRYTRTVGLGFKTPSEASTNKNQCFLHYHFCQ